MQSLDDELRYGLLEADSRLLKYALSTIQSPSFSQVRLIFQGNDFLAIRLPQHSVWPHLRELSEHEKSQEASRHCGRFRLLNKLHQVREFRLELHVEVWEPLGEYVVRKLKEAVATEKTRGQFDCLFPEPLVTFSPLLFFQNGAGPGPYYQWLLPPFEGS